MAGSLSERRRRSAHTTTSMSPVSDVSPGSRWPITATALLPGGGTFRLTGDVGPMDPTDATLTPLDAMVAVDGLNLAKTGFLNPSAGGLLALKATVASKGGVAAIVGDATLSKALLVTGGSPASRPVAVSFDVRYDLHTHTGTLNPSSLKMGRAAARLAGTYDARGEATVVNIKVAGARMSAPELEAFLPALGVHLPHGAHLAAGTIEANLNVAGAIGRLVAAGNVGLSKARLTGFDLGSNMRAISAFTGLHTGSDLNIESMTTNVRVAADGLRFDHFNADVASLGHITGTGTIDARNNLHFGMVATLANLTLPSPLSGKRPGGVTGAAVWLLVRPVLSVVSWARLPEAAPRARSRAPSDTSPARPANSRMNAFHSSSREQRRIPSSFLISAGWRCTCSKGSWARWRCLADPVQGTREPLARYRYCKS